MWAIGKALEVSVNYERLVERGRVLRMFDFKKPLPRKEYWKYVGIIFAIFLVVGVFIGGTPMGNIIAYTPEIVLWIILEIRRFHDANKTGWLALLNLLLPFNPLILAGVLKSDYTNNKWIVIDEETTVKES